MITINAIAILKWYSIILVLFALVGSIIKDIIYKDFDIATILGIIIYIPLFIYLLIN